jgi:CHASE3 domain sensor protein/GAF domain-containing protein
VEHQGLEANFTMTTQPSSRKRPAQILTAVNKLSDIRFLRDMSIPRKLALGFGVLVILILVSAGVSFLGSYQATIQIDTTDEVRVPIALDAAHAQADLLRMQANVRGYLALGDQEYRDSYLDARQAFEDDLEQLESMSAELDELSNYRLTRLRVIYEEWSELPEHLFELRDDQLDREPAYRLLVITGTQYAGQVLIDINTMIELQGYSKDPTEEDLALLEDMAEFQGNFAAMLSAMRGYVTTRNRIYRGEYEVNLLDNQNAWSELRKRRDALSPDQQEILDNITQNREAFLVLPDQIFDTLEGERWREDLYIFSEKAVPLANEMQDLLDGLVTAQQTFLEDELDDGRRSLSTTNWLILSGGVIALIFGLAAAYLARATIARPVRRLTAVAEQIRAGDLNAQARVESGDEIGILAETFNNMTGQLRQTLTQVRKEKKRADDLLQVVIPIGVELTTEKDFNRLLEKMLLEAQSFCNADAGTLYLRTDDDQLEFVIVRNNTHNVAIGGTTGHKVPFPPLPLQDQTTAKAGRIPITTQVALDGVSSNIPDHDHPSDIVEDYHVTSLLTIPLKDSLGQVLGVLQLLNATDPETGQFIPFDQNLQQMMESFSSLAVAALEAYIREQSLRQEIQELRIEIDEVKKSKAVAEITESDYFQELQKKARRLRDRSKPGREKRSAPTQKHTGMEKKERG